jgi:hypothetical protein
LTKKSSNPYNTNENQVFTAIQILQESN